MMQNEENKVVKEIKEYMTYAYEHDREAYECMKFLMKISDRLTIEEVSELLGYLGRVKIVDKYSDSSVKLK